MSSKQVILATTILIILSSLITMACEPPPPPPPNDWGCSPGFWKNHTGSYYWGPFAFDYSGYPDSNGLGLYEALSQKGWGDMVAKWAAVYFLNTSPYTNGAECY